MKRFCVVDTSKWPLRYDKWALVSQRLKPLCSFAPDPQEIARDKLVAFHDAAYVDRFLDGRMSELEMRRIGFPFSKPLQDRVLRVTGAAIDAANELLQRDAVAVIGGGAHHAAWGQGAGYCVFNDLIASYFELKDRGKCAIIDLDVHQGDGTIQIVNRLKMSDFPILDLSAKGNFPFRKQVPLLGKSVLLEDRLQDDAYLEVLERELQLFVRAHGKFDFILYQAGVDVLEGDKLGRLGLTLNGLKRRDAMVYALAKSMGARCLSFCGGGYFEKDDKIGLENVVAAHVQQILEMRNAFE